MLEGGRRVQMLCAVIASITVSSSLAVTERIWAECFVPCRSLIPVLLGCIGLQGTQKFLRNVGDCINRRKERRFVCLGWLIEAANLPDVLKRSRVDLIRRDRRIEIEQHLDVPAHSGDLHSNPG